MHEVHGLNIGFSLSQSGKIKRAKIYPKLGKLKEKKNNKTQLQPLGKRSANLAYKEAKIKECVKLKNTDDI